jgi:GT2 family glycosyltransferase
LKPQILIVTPFRNEDHSIRHYLKALKAVEYPKELIDLYWLENDSSDKTLSMLKTAKGEMPFKSTTLKSINILGSVKKRKSGEYIKDISYGRGLRKHPWIVIWNDHFLPLVEKMKHKYVLFWYADAVPPPNVITEYLKVFDKYSNAGWVGGRMHRRFPRQNDITSPRLIGKRPKLTNSQKAAWVKATNTAIEEIKNPTEVKITMHVFMIPRNPLCKCKLYYDPREMHFSIINGLAEQGLRVYYQPTVYIKHVSTDGKIWRI